MKQSLKKYNREKRGKRMSAWEAPGFHHDRKNGQAVLRKGKSAAGA